MLKPTKRMLEFLSWERGLFFHFGIRTFNEGRKDWDYVDMPVDTFNPAGLDCRQWARTAKEAGFSYAVMTAKHHDGFCLWQTEHSDYSVKNCAWRDGQGDVVREYLEAMREYGIKTGIYYSPADQIVFSSNFSTAEHNKLIYNHLLELCSNYGEIDYLWFDNCGSDKCVYEWDKIMTEVIRKHQPNTVVNSNGDVESCWVGNEAGYAPRPCMYIHDLDSYGADRVSKNLLERVEDGKFWSPAEADCMLDDDSWFFREDGRNVKTIDTLMGIYLYSVGRGINFLLNIAPDREGLLPEPDRSRLLEFGAEIQKRFTEPVAGMGDMERSGNLYKLALDKPAVISHVVLREDIVSGHKIRRFRILCQPYLHSRESVVLYDGTEIGHKAICCFPSIYLKELTLEICESEDAFSFKGIDVFGPR